MKVSSGRTSNGTRTTTTMISFQTNELHFDNPTSRVVTGSTHSISALAKSVLYNGKSKEKVSVQFELWTC